MKQIIRVDYVDGENHSLSTPAVSEILHVRSRFAIQGVRVILNNGVEVYTPLHQIKAIVSGEVKDD